MSTKLSNIRKLNQQVKSLKGQLRANSRNFSTSNAPVNYGTSWASSSKPLRMKQCERIATIIASSTAGSYHVDSFAINPGNSTTFPWLGNIARLFDRYKFHDLKFKFVNYASTTTSGNVTLAVDFDTLDTPPTDSVGMSNMAKFVSFAPWKCETLSIPVNRRGVQQYLFTYDSNAESGSNIDLKTYNLGNFLVSTEGMPADQVAGYIVAEYDVELFDKNDSYQSVLDIDFCALDGSTLNESSGLTISYDDSIRTIKIDGLVVGEQYNTNLMLTAGLSTNLLVGLSPVTGECYVDSSNSWRINGVCEATASSASFTSTVTSTPGYCVATITKI